MRAACRRKPFGTGSFCPITRVKYVQGKDAFRVFLESGEVYALSNRELRRSNDLAYPGSRVESIWMDAETRSGFFVRYEDGTEAEASWELVVEEPPVGKATVNGRGMRARASKLTGRSGR